MFGIALGYEDLNDHDELRHDPMLAVLSGKLAAGREDCAPVAGKSTLNRLELSRLEPTRYHKISHNPVAMKRLFVDLFRFDHFHVKGSAAAAVAKEPTSSPRRRTPSRETAWEVSKKSHPRAGRMSKRTRFSAKTSVVTSRIGPALRRNG
ncbi:MAG TPA: transposase [Steroidobacteraceae bacterium]|nr:transposase [Steroidobacteraceae bacterium]